MEKNEVVFEDQGMNGILIMYEGIGVGHIRIVKGEVFFEPFEYRSFNIDLMEQITNKMKLLNTTI